MGTDLFVLVCSNARAGPGPHVFSTDSGLPRAGTHRYSFAKVFPGNLFPSSGPVSVSGGGSASHSGREGVLWLFPEHSVGVSSRRPGCLDVLVRVRAFARMHVCVCVCVRLWSRVDGWVPDLRR